jgi:DNA-binding CsgD family transcriptional regulator
MLKQIQTEMFFATLIENISEGIAVFAERELIYANSFFCKITNSYQDNPKKNTLMDFFDPSLFDSVSTESPSAFETSIRCLFDETKPVRVNAFFSETVFAEKKVLIVIIIDLSEQKKLLTYLREARKYLKKKIEERTGQLKEISLKLSRRSKYIAGINSALKILVETRDRDIAEFNDDLWATINHSVFPYINRLKNMGLSDPQSESVTLIEKNLREIFSGNKNNSLQIKYKLSPAESNIANLVKIGKTTKEIALIAGISPRTVERHRDNIRKKIGIQGKKTSLRFFLLTQNTQ